MSKIQQIFEREKIKRELVSDCIEVFEFPSELVNFIFSIPVNDKISEFVWKLPINAAVSPVVISRTELAIDGIDCKTMYYGSLMKEVLTQEDFLCRGAFMYIPQKELFSGLRDYRGRDFTTNNKPILVKLERMIDITDAQTAHKSVAVGFLTSLSVLEKTDMVWLPLVSK